MASATFVSPERVYVDAQGNVVPESSPEAHQLLVPAGGEIPFGVAVKHGLIDAEDAIESVAQAVDAEIAKVTGRKSLRERFIEHEAGNAEASSNVEADASGKQAQLPVETKDVPAPDATKQAPPPAQPQPASTQAS